MRRIDLIKAAMEGWARLSPAQREKFFEAFVQCGGAARPACVAGLASAAARGQRRSPLRSIRRRFTISDADFALLMRAARGAPGEAAGPDRDKADGG